MYGVWLLRSCGSALCTACQQHGRRNSVKQLNRLQACDPYVEVARNGSVLSQQTWRCKARLNDDLGPRQCASGVCMAVSDSRHHSNTTYESMLMAIFASSIHASSNQLTAESGQQQTPTGTLCVCGLYSLWMLRQKQSEHSTGA